MIRKIDAPTVIAAAGDKAKRIEEYVAVCLPAFSPDSVHRDA